jgi:hypothetical protein
MAASLRFIYSVLDQLYRHGKLNFINGDDGDPVIAISNPADTGVDDIAPYTDGDPEVFSYMGGANLDTPRAVLCNVTTDFSATPPSTGKYSVCTPSSGWSITGPRDIALKNSSGKDVAGNPYGIAQAGGFLYIVDYDSANIYILNIANFEAATGVTYQVDGEIPYAPPAESSMHGQALLVLTAPNGNTYLYALFNTDNGAGASYSASTLMRYRVDPSTGALTNLASITLAGFNAQALVPAPGTADGIGILIPSVGGRQQAGTTNGPASLLEYVPAFATFSSGLTIAFTGDASASVTPTGTYDIRGVAVSEDGKRAYLVTVTYNASYLTCWRLYQTTVDKIFGITTPASKTLSDAVDDSTLIAVDSTASRDGDPGYYWEIQYENAETQTNGRLWFVKGSPIRISLGNDYSVFKLFDAGSGGPLYSPSFNVNSADLIGEMIYQASKGVSKDTRLIKGSARQAAQSAKAAAAEEEEK